MKPRTHDFSPVVVVHHVEQWKCVSNLFDSADVLKAKAEQQLRQIMQNNYSHQLLF